MKGPNKIRVDNEKRNGNHFRNRRGLSHDVGAVKNANFNKLFGGKPGQIDWNSYLPRLRKDIVGLDPMAMSGSIWPQK